MDDLVFRLRDSAKYYKHYSNIPTLPIELNKAAEEIERLRRVERAARSLVIFAKNVPSIYLRDLNDLMAALEEK